MINLNENIKELDSAITSGKTAISNAINSKGGNTTPQTKLVDMATAIGNLSGGGQSSFTENELSKTVEKTEFMFSTSITNPQPKILAADRSFILFKTSSSNSEMQIVQTKSGNIDIFSRNLDSSNTIGNVRGDYLYLFYISGTLKCDKIQIDRESDYADWLYNIEKTIDTRITWTDLQCIYLNKNDNCFYVCGKNSGNFLVKIDESDNVTTSTHSYIGSAVMKLAINESITADSAGNAFYNGKKINDIIPYNNTSDYFIFSDDLKTLYVVNNKSLCKYNVETQTMDKQMFYSYNVEKVITSHAFIGTNRYNTPGGKNIMKNNNTATMFELSIESDKLITKQIDFPWPIDNVFKYDNDCFAYISRSNSTDTYGYIGLSKMEHIYNVK